MRKILLFLGCCLLGWGTTALFAQQGFVVTGGDAAGAGGSVSLSIGQVDYLHAAGNNGSINQGLQQPDAMHGLCGTLTYDNAAGTVLNNCQVLLMQGAVIAAQTTTDDNGYYLFSNPETGDFSLNALCTKPWGSVNATDALLILKHFTGIDPLAGLRLTAADVDASGYVNAGDGLNTLKRFTGMISSFIPGDWVFEQPAVTIGTENLVVDFKGLCYGDVDGSYIPPNIKAEPTIFLENQGVIAVNGGQVITLPVRLRQALNPAAVSFVLNCPADVEILGVEAAYDNQNLLYNRVGNQLRAGWYTLNPRNLSAGDVLITLTVQLQSNPAETSDLQFNLTAETSIADYQANVYYQKTLTMPALVTSREGFSLSQNIPNPFSAVTQITYSLPEDGTIRLEMLDVVGKLVNVVEDKQETAGTHTIFIDGASMPAGVYFYRMTVNMGSQEFSQTKRMVVSR